MRELLMAVFFNRPINQLLYRAQVLLVGSQQEFGELLSVSRKTAARYIYGESTPLMSQVKDLARLVYAKGDEALAKELAEATSETLESLGLVPPAKPPEALTPLVVDSVVCAAADGFETAPATMRGTRAAVFAAFRRARQLGLSVEAVENALAPPEPAPPPELLPRPTQRAQSRSRSARRGPSSGE
jgi:hypothetical protein